jgi:transposase
LLAASIVNRTGGTTMMTDHDDYDEPETLRVIGGVDTHKEVHVAAVLDELGRLLDTASFPADAAGYRQLTRWLCGYGEVLAIGVEGTGSWGAGLSRHLRARGVNVIEVNRTNRQTRRRKGKTDTVDAEAAARAVLAGDATVTPKSGDGPIESIRQLRVARAGAMKARTAAANQMHSLTDTAPDELRAKLRALTTLQRARTCARLRPGDAMTPSGAAKIALRAVGSRWLALHDEIREHNKTIKTVLDQIAAPMLARHGVGYDTAGALLCAAGDNPERLNTEGSYAALCGSSPVEISSGKTNRHRLNRAGDRNANAALWTIVMVRIRSNHQPTVNYIERRTTDGLSKREAIRCLKRYVAREIHKDIRAITTAHAATRNEPKIAA